MLQLLLLFNRFIYIFMLRFIATDCNEDLQIGSPFTSELGDMRKPLFNIDMDILLQYIYR